MTEYVTGQIYGWNGGECPVHPETKIKIWTRNGLVDPDAITYAECCVWKHMETGYDIVCFKVITPYAEPKVIWVNEYADGAIMASFRSEEEAKRWQNKGHTRVAVKYVEVNE
jgi:hypothetical protein